MSENHIEGMRELAIFLNISLATANKYMKNGEIPAPCREVEIKGKIYRKWSKDRLEATRDELRNKKNFGRPLKANKEDS